MAPDLEKLRRVAEDLAERLVTAGLVREDDVTEALSASSPEPQRTTVEVPVSAPLRQNPVASQPDTSPIFVVHGHDHGLLHGAVRVLERATGRDVVVLHEQASAGRTLIEKFETHAGVAGYAVVLLTADDKGGVATNELRARARQNVIFELGFFFGRLGRDRVAVLLEPGVEQPSDIAGLVYIPVDPSGSWKYALARELQAGGIPVKYERIP